MTQFMTQNSLIPAYMAYPRFLLTVKLNETAKLVYMLLLDRARLSMQTEGWQDEQGHVFINYTIENLAEAIGKSEMTVKGSLKALEAQGLIYRHRQGSGKPNRIYVKIPIENCLTGRTGNYPSGRTAFDRQTDRKVSAINNKNNNRESYVRNYDFEEGESF